MYLQCTLEVQYSFLIEKSSQIFDLKFVSNFNVDPNRSTIQNSSQILTSIVYSNWKIFPIQNLVYYNVHFTYIVSTLLVHFSRIQCTFELRFSCIFFKCTSNAHWRYNSVASYKFMSNFWLEVCIQLQCGHKKIHHTKFKSKCDFNFI